jgi:hypothetical protein
MHMASRVNIRPLPKAKELAMTTRLDTIVLRQRKSRIRDLAFAALVVVAGAISLSSVSAAADAASMPTITAR